MAGIKGQKWSTDRPDRKIKTSTAIKTDVFKKLEKLSKKNKWSISSTISNIIEEYFNGKR